VNLPAVLFVVVAGFFLFKLPRQWAALPLLIGASYMTLGPSLDIGPLHFTVIRILVAIGVVRVMVRGERIGNEWHILDKLMVFWGLATIFSAVFHRDIAEALVFRLGLAYNGLGLYFLLRVFIQDTSDIFRICTMVLITLVPVAVEMVVESITTRNFFSFLGGVSEFCEIRGGKPRAQGPFAHSILAGTVGAVCLPMALAIWRRNRRLALIGLVATGTIIVCSRSSGPIMAAFFALFGVMLWKFRHRMRLIRWSLVLGILALAAVMNAPIYYILDRIDFTGNSTGWHRAYLMESALTHFSDWCLGGTDFTRDWTPNAGYNDDETDITNHYIRMAVWGGLPMLVLFVASLGTSFRRVGSALRSAPEAPDQEQFMIWCLGSILFSHAATMISVSYFDQSVFFLYLVLAAIGSLHIGPVNTALVDELLTT
jgi:hypothetical protein